jgi:multiple sugar transport system substrate-binding protein
MSVGTAKALDPPLPRRGFMRGTAGIAAALASVSASRPSVAQQASLRWSAIAFGPEALALWQQIATRAEGHLPGVKIKVEGTPFNDYWTKLQTQLASGGSADLLQMQSLRFPQYASRGVLKPLDDFYATDAGFDAADFYPTIRRAFEHNGRLQILPFDLGGFVTYVNADLFRAAGVPLPDPAKPMSWDELARTAKALTNPGKGTYGMVLSPDLESSIPWIWSNGGEVFGADMKSARLNAPETVVAMKFLFDLLFVHKVAVPVRELSNANFGPEAFVGGKVGMYFDGPWRFVSIRQNARFDWDVVPFPAGQAGSIPWVAGSGWGVSTQSKNPELAWKVLRELTSTDSLKVLYDAGRVFPARQSTFAKRAPTTAPPNNAGMVDKVLRGEIGRARPLLTPPSYAEILQAARQTLTPLFVEAGDTATAMADLQDQVQSLLGRD